VQGAGPSGAGVSGREDLLEEHDAESPLWDAATARLWWVDITGQRVHSFDPATGNQSSWGTAGQPGGVVLDTAGEPVVASPEALAVLDRSTGTMDLRVPIEQDRPGNRANDIKTDGRDGPGSARWPSSGPVTPRCTGSTAARRPVQSASHTRTTTIRKTAG
jgi:sugar lactone lactonase YvrE